MEKKQAIHELAKGASSVIGNVRYGRIRKKLDKNGLSEIGLFSVVADHLEENYIKPVNYISQMAALLDGLERNPFFFNTSEGKEFKFLRHQESLIKHGDLTRSEPKSAEQKGSFLCNRCFYIKMSVERSSSKSMKHTCKPCIADAQRRYIKEKQDKPEQIEPVTQVLAPVPAEQTSNQEELKAKDFSSLQIVELNGDADMTIISLNLTCNTMDIGDVMNKLKTLIA